MTRPALTAALAFLGILAMASIALGRTETRFNTGACEPPNARVDSWWSVTTYVDGVPTMVSGRDCLGNLYFNRPINIRFVSADPTAGRTPTHEGLDENGNGWIAVIAYDGAHDPVWMCGRTGGGAFWVADPIDLFVLE
jgi:hypothetical protein